MVWIQSLYKRESKKVKNLCEKEVINSSKSISVSEFLYKLSNSFSVNTLLTRVPRVSHKSLTFLISLAYVLPYNDLVRKYSAFLIAWKYFYSHENIIDKHSAILNMFEWDFFFCFCETLDIFFFFMTSNYIWALNFK